MLLRKSLTFVVHINSKLNHAVSLSDEQPEISVTYFRPDSKKNGGEYPTDKSCA